jgi:hypothetical protein
VFRVLESIACSSSRPTTSSASHVRLQFGLASRPPAASSSRGIPPPSEMGLFLNQQQSSSNFQQPHPSSNSSSRTQSETNDAFLHMWYMNFLAPPPSLICIRDYYRWPFHFRIFAGVYHQCIEQRHRRTRSHEGNALLGRLANEKTELDGATAVLESLDNTNSTPAHNKCTRDTISSACFTPRPSYPPLQASNWSPWGDVEVLGTGTRFILVCAFTMRYLNRNSVSDFIDRYRCSGISRPTL